MLIIGLLCLLVDLVLLVFTPRGSLLPVYLTVGAALFLAGGALVVLRARTAALRETGDSLQTLRTRYQQLLDGSNRAVLAVALDADALPTRIVEANAAACARWGLSAEDFFSMSPATLFAEGREGDLTALFEDLRHQEQATVETVVAMSDGRRIPVEVFARRVENDDAPALLFVRDIREQSRVEESLREVRATLRALNSTAQLAIISLDTAGNISTWNAAAETLFGHKEYQVFGRPLPVIAPEQQAEYDALLDRARQETVTGVQLNARRADGQAVTMTLSATPQTDPDGNATGVLLIAADVTGQQQALRDEAHMRQALAFVSETKKAMFRASNEQELLQSVCETVVRVGGFGLAWVGFPEQDANKTVRPVAWAGTAGENFSATRIPCATSHDPLATAIRSGNIAVAQHMLTVTQRVPWLADAVGQGYGAVAALPLLAGWHAIGAVVLYSVQPEPFDARQQELLAEFADDLAFAVEAVRTREERQRAQEALLASAHHWRATFDTIPSPICVVDSAGAVTRCNQAMAAFLNAGTEAILGQPLCRMVHGSTPPEDCLLAQVAAHGRQTSSTLPLGDRWFTVTVDPIHDGDGQYQGAIHVMNDVTERMKAEQELKQNYRRLLGVIDETITAIITIAEMRDPYTAGHERRVSQLACAIGQEMDLAEERIEGLRIAGLLHDIGKLSVPSEILSKSGALTDIEFGIIKGHAQAGYEILRTIDFPWPIALMAQQHHERMDGGGYPNHLPGDQILLEARILAVSDVVESMASHRPYRPARGLDAALGEVTQRAGVAYDADVVAACVKVFTEQHFTFSE